MEAAGAGLGIRSVLGRVSQLLAGKKGGANAAEHAAAQMVRPVVGETSRWTTVQIPVSKKDDNRRIEDVIRDRYDVSVPLVQTLLRKGKITVMRAPMAAVTVEKSAEKPIVLEGAARSIIPRASMRVEPGDLITLTELFLPEKTTAAAKPLPIEDRKLTGEEIRHVQGLVIYKDERIIVLNKPSGLAMHSGPKTKEHLAGWLSGLQFDAETPPLIVHRLDKDTSGALLLARNRKVAAEVAERMRESGLDSKIQKVYWAMVKGKPDRRHRQGEIATNIYRVLEGPNEKMTSFADRRADLLDEGKVAITHYRWMQVHVRKKPQAEKLSLMELKPLTGRTHQLRVHLAEQLRLPIYGDYRYNKDQPLGRQMHLHCYRITLAGWFGDGKDLTIKASIPKHFVKTMHSHPLKLREVPKFARKNK